MSQNISINSKFTFTHTWYVAYLADPLFPLPFQIVGEIVRENIPLEFPLALPLEYAFYDLQG